MILVFFLVCFLTAGIASAQEFVRAVDADLYPTPTAGVSIPNKSGYAVLKVHYIPAQQGLNNAQVLSTEIVKLVASDNDNPYNLGGYGWYRFVQIGDQQVTEYAHIITGSTLYYRTSDPNLGIKYIRDVQAKLVAQNLGTVGERESYINSLEAGAVPLVDVDAIFGDMLKILQPWITTFLGFALTLFVVDVFSARSKRLIASANRIKMRKERAEERRQIRNDQTAQVYEVRLDWLARVRSGAVSDPNISPRQARRMFEDAAYDYAEYRRSRGWKY